MIKIDIMEYIRDRVWHGWWYHRFGGKSHWEWRHDMSPCFRWKVVLFEEAAKGGHYDQTEN